MDHGNLHTNIKVKERIVHFFATHSTETNDNNKFNNKQFYIFWDKECVVLWNLCTFNCDGLKQTQKYTAVAFHWNDFVSQSIGWTKMVY